MEKSKFEIVASAASVAILVGWTIFWMIQVFDVIEVLEMAYE